MDSQNQTLEPIIRGKADKDITYQGLPFEYKPFGEVEVVRPKRGQKIELKIKGLQQFDISNNYGIILCVNGKFLQAYYGANLKEEAQIEFENEISCLKISEFDESLIAIGFEGSNKLKIFQLIPFISSKLQNLVPLKEVQINGEFNQIYWSNSPSNNLILRSSQKKKTIFVNFNTLEQNDKLGETDAVCFDLKENIISINQQSMYLWEKSDFENEPIESDIGPNLPHNLSRVFFLQEFEQDRWFVIGFNRNNADDKDNEDDAEGMQVELIVLKGDINISLEVDSKDSIFPIDGSISDMNKYRDCLEFKIVKQGDAFTLFQSVASNSQTFLMNNEKKIIEDAEFKVRNIKGQVRGASYAKFQIDEENAYLEISKNDKIYYQHIPPCVITYDSELAISKYFFCYDFSLSESAKNQPQNPLRRTNKLQNKQVVSVQEQPRIEKKEEEEIPIKENIRQEEKKEESKDSSEVQKNNNQMQDVEGINKIKEENKQISGRADRSVTYEGLSYEVKPFGEGEKQQKPKRGQKIELKIKGLQQQDISNKHGVLFCAHGNKLKVYCGVNLSEEAEVEFQNQITCLKINRINRDKDYEESLLAIGFDDIHELHIFSLIPFVQSKLTDQDGCIKIKVSDSFNQIKWNTTDNNLILRNTENLKTFFVNFQKKEVNEDLKETDAVCFDLSGNIVSIKKDAVFFYQDQDLDNVIENDINTSLFHNMSRIFHIQEYQPNKWFIIGFYKENERANDDDIDELQVELAVCTGDITNLQKGDKQSILSIIGSIPDMYQYKKFLEFKLVNISEGVYTLFQSVTANSQTFSIENEGQHIVEIDELQVKNISGQVRGAHYTTFQIDNDNAYLHKNKDEHDFFQKIPTCITTFDSELTILKYFICEDFYPSEQAKKQPLQSSRRPVQLANPLRFDPNYAKKQVNNQCQIQQVSSNPINLVAQQVQNQPKLEEKQAQQLEQVIPQNQDKANNNQQQPQPNNAAQLPSGEQQIQALNLQLTRESVWKYIKNFENYQSQVQKLVYSNQRYAYDHTKDFNKIKQKYQFTTTQVNHLEKDFHSLFHQPTIHSMDYIYEQDKLLMCTNEPNGQSYIYAFSFQQYNQIHEIIKQAEDTFNRIKNDKKIQPRENMKLKAEHIKNSQIQLQNEMSKYRIFTSNSQIIQIHVIYSYFLGIVFKDGLTIKSLDTLLQNNNNNPEPYNLVRQFDFEIKQLIFSRSKKYFLILTSDKQVVVMNTLTQQVYYRRGGILFANFGYDDEKLIYILEADSLTVFNFIDKQQIEKCNKFSDLKNYSVIHFEEYKSGYFYSIQYAGNRIVEECNDCDQGGCQSCREDQLSIFISKKINSFIKFDIDESHGWNGKLGINQHCQAKCHYNPQIKQLVTVFNQQGTVQILNIDEKDDVVDPGFKLPYWKLTKTQISGVIYFPYRLHSEDDFFSFKQDEGYKNTYLLPSIMIFSGLFHLTRVFLFDDYGTVLIENEDDNIQQLLKSKNTLIAINQYIQIINGDLSRFTTKPDFYLLYEKMEQFKHILQFLQENNLNDIIEAEFSSDLFEIQQQQPQPIQQQQDGSSKKQEGEQIDQEYLKRLVLATFQELSAHSKQYIQQNTRQYKDQKYYQVPQNVVINQLKQIQAPNPSIQGQVQSIGDRLSERIKEELNKIERLQIQVSDLNINLNNKYQQPQMGPKQFIGINQVVNYNSLQVSIFAIKNQLFISQNGRALQELNNSTRNIDLNKFTEIQYLAKFPQKNDNKIHLLAAFKIPSQGLFSQASILYHICIEENLTQFKVIRQIFQYSNRNIVNVSAYEEENEILVTFSDKTVSLILAYGQSDPPIVLQQWDGANFATFSLIGTILISFNNRSITEYVIVQIESGIEVVQRRSKNFQEMILFMHQFNSECILAVGAKSSTNLTIFPMLYSTLSVIENKKDELNYDVQLKIDLKILDQIQFKASYSKDMRQVYLTHNLSNTIYIFPLSMNNIVYKPSIQEYQIPNSAIQNVNGFYLSHQDKDSATYKAFDFLLGKGAQIVIQKRKESLLYNLDS